MSVQFAFLLSKSSGFQEKLTPPPFKDVRGWDYWLFLSPSPGFGHGFVAAVIIGLKHV
jgi:hypothetical protein